MTDMIRRFAPATVRSLGDDECEITLATRALALDDDIWDMDGGDLSHYEAHPVLLFNHEPEHPVARASNIQRSADKITARATFAPAGVSHKADEVRGLVKSGILTGVSAGILPVESEPLDPKNPRRGRKIKKWKLLEASFVSVPADKGAAVTARQAKESDMAEWKVGASRDLPVEDSDGWDGPAAEKSIFEHAGGDDFDPAKARKGFLVYDASKPNERGSYKLPIAHVVGGELKVPKGAIRAAAARLPQTEIPDDVKKRAEAVLDHYKEKAGIGDKKDGDRSFKSFINRMQRQAGQKLTLKRGLYDVAQLACALEQLGWIKNCADVEKALEGDGSEVPDMIGDVLVDLGEAFLSMAEEEVSELLENTDSKDTDDDATVTREERAFIDEGKNEHVRAFRRGVVLARAGKKISAENAKVLRSALADHSEAIEMHRSAIKKHKQAMGNVQDMMDRSGVPAEDDAPEDQVVQKSDGTQADDGSRAASDADFRRRQADLLRLSAR